MPVCCICKEDVPTTVTIPCANGGHSAGWCDDCAWTITQTNTIAALESREVVVGRDGYAFFPLQLPCPICRGAVCYTAKIGEKEVPVHTALWLCLARTLELYSRAGATLLACAMPLLLICISLSTTTCDATGTRTEFGRHPVFYAFALVLELIGCIASGAELLNLERSTGVVLAHLLSSLPSALAVFIVGGRGCGRGLLETVATIVVARVAVRLGITYRRVVEGMPRDPVLIGVDY